MHCHSILISVSALLVTSYLASGGNASPLLNERDLYYRAVDPLPFNIDPAFTAVINLDISKGPGSAPIGVPGGVLVNEAITGGTVTGPLINATILSGFAHPSVIENGTVQIAVIDLFGVTSDNMSFYIHEVGIGSPEAQVTRICDEIRPACGQCTKSRRECEGYERYATFLNRTEKGLEKRTHLSEVRCKSNTEDNKAGPSSSNPPPSNQEIPLAKVAEMPSPLIIDPTAVYQQQLIGLFVSTYLPSPDQRFRTQTPSWLAQAFSIARPTSALRLALSALSVTKIGRMHNDEALIKQGSNCYVLGLREIQIALLNEQLMWNEETLAASRALANFELYESTTNSPQAWSSHQSGSARLIELRGPQRYSTLLASAILDDFRYSSMIHSIQTRRACFLSAPPWSSNTANHRDRQSHLFLYDLGLELAALLEKHDYIVASDDPIHRPAFLFYCMKDFVALEARLRTWYDHYSLLPPQPAFWNEPRLVTRVDEVNGFEFDFDLDFDPVEAGNEQFLYRDLPTAHTIITYASADLKIGQYAIQTLLAATMMGLRQKLPPRLGKAPERPTAADPSTFPRYSLRTTGPLQAFTQTSQSQPHPSISPSMTQQIPSSDPTSPPTPLTYASQIRRSIRYCLRPENGLIGPLGCLFPLTVAFGTYDRMAKMGTGFEAERAECAELLRRLADEKGLSSSKVLARGAADWGARVQDGSM
ncbi:hypothetical protein MMC25_001778 [Agyrium rufum]|nr:hypothetical protein [Agyrium rufum]